jgi:hypothetical protein
VKRSAEEYIPSQLFVPGYSAVTTVFTGISFCKKKMLQSRQSQPGNTMDKEACYIEYFYNKYREKVALSVG